MTKTSVDMSAALRAWYDNPLRQTSSIPSYSALADQLGLDSSTVRLWAVPASLRGHLGVPAGRVYDLCRLTGIPEPTPVTAPGFVRKKRCETPQCWTRVIPPETLCPKCQREGRQIDKQLAATRPPAGEPILNWDCVCLAAGHQVMKRWTARIARLWMVSGDMKCAQCGSAVLIEQAVLTNRVSVR